MNDKAVQAELMEIVDILLFAPDEFGLNEVCAHVKYDLGIADDHEVKRLTLKIVHELLQRGVRVDFDSGIPTSKHHPEKTPVEIIGRIDREWDTLGELPTIPGEICVFEWTPSAMETYARRQARSREGA